MRFNVRFILIYVMPYVAVIASLWSYPERLDFRSSQGESVSDSFVRAAGTYVATVFFTIVWIVKAKQIAAASSAAREETQGVKTH